MLSTMMFFLMLMLIKPKHIWYLMPPMLLILAPMLLIKLLQYSMNPMFISSIWMVDKFSAPGLFLLMQISAIITVCTKKFNKDGKNQNFPHFLMIFIIILTSMLLSSNLFMSHLLLEASIIPSIFMTIPWLHKSEHIQASVYLILYLTMNLFPMMMIILNVYMKNGSTVLLLNMKLSLSEMSSALWLMMMFTMLVKLPMFMAILMPKTKNKVTVANSIILALILLSLGMYNIIRVMFMFYQMNVMVMLMMFSLLLIKTFYISLLCTKRLYKTLMALFLTIGHIIILLVMLITVSKLGVNEMMAALFTMHSTSSYILYFMINPDQNTYLPSELMYCLFMLMMSLTTAQLMYIVFDNFFS